MTYNIGDYIDLRKVNRPFAGTFQDEPKETYDYTFKVIGDTLKAFRHIPVVSA